MTFPVDTVPGWILIHAEAKYAGTKWKTPMRELAALYEPGLRWHWNWSSPMKERGEPHHVLLAWKGNVFGEAIVTLTQQVEEGMEDYDFAFVLWQRRITKRVPLTKLLLDNRSEDHRSLIKLDAQVVRAFRRLTK